MPRFTHEDGLPVFNVDGGGNDVAQRYGSAGVDSTSAVAAAVDYLFYEGNWEQR